MSAGTPALAEGRPQPVLPTTLAEPPRTRVRLVRPEKPTWGPFEAYGAIVLALVLVARFVPLAKWLPFWGCSLRKLTGYPCLSCGMTRSFDWFAQGRLVDSLLINPLGFALAATSVVAVVWLVAIPLRPPRLEVTLSDRAFSVVRWLVLLALAGNWGYLVTRTLLTGG
jgi:hypothetical protein